MMKWIKTYEQFNPSELGLKMTFDEWINASNLAELNFKSIFKSYDTDLEQLANDPNFLEDLSKRNLVATDLQSSKDLANLLDVEIKYIFINVSDEKNPNVQEPKYILIEHNDKIRLFYNVEDLNRFHEKLCSRIIKVTDPTNLSQHYVYMTSNAGTNWELQNMDDETDTFRKDMSGEMLVQMQKNGTIEIKITN